MLPLAQFVAHQVRDREPALRRAPRRPARPSAHWFGALSIWPSLRPEPRRTGRRAC